MMPQAQIAKERAPRAGRVLLVEDHLEMRRLLASLLQRDGHEVVEAGDGIKALTPLLGRCGDPEIDLIVTDLRLPGCTGLDLLAFVRLERPATPVVLITAFGDSATHAEARRLGVAAVLDKPFDLYTFRELVTTLCSTRMRFDSATVRSAPEDTMSPHVPGPPGELRDAFDAFDKNGDGLVSIEELLTLMDRIGQTLSRAEAEDALRRGDTDGDGQLSFDEFVAFMLSVR